MNKTFQKCTDKSDFTYNSTKNMSNNTFVSCGTKLSCDGWPTNNDYVYYYILKNNSFFHRDYTFMLVSKSGYGINLLCLVLNIILFIFFIIWFYFILYNFGYQ